MIEEINPLAPAAFFAIAADIYPSKGPLLPDLSAFHGTPPFADVTLTWSPEGLSCSVSAKSPHPRSSFPDVTAADSVELFIDTRNVKTSGWITKFCHHFFFLPQVVETEERRVQAGEITHFRTDDRHELCDPALLQVTCKREKKGYLLQIFIPSECLFGYDPQQFKQIGFTYRINRPGEDPQNFAVASSDFPIESHPNLWATINLER